MEQIIDKVNSADYSGDSPPKKLSKRKILVRDILSSIGISIDKVLIDYSSGRNIYLTDKPVDVDSMCESLKRIADDPEDGRISQLIRMDTKRPYIACRTDEGTSKQNAMWSFHIYLPTTYDPRLLCIRGFK